MIFRFFIAFVFLGTVECAKILVWNPLYAYSHYTFLNKLADVLVDEGHNITVLIPEFDPSKSVKTAAKANILIRSKPVTSFSIVCPHAQEIFWTNNFEIIRLAELGKGYHEHNNIVCERLYQDKAFIARVKAENFELAILEPLDYCGFGLLKLIGLKNYVIATPMSITDHGASLLGLPGRSVAVSTYNSDYYTEMNFLERIENYLTPWIFKAVINRELSRPAVEKYVDKNFNSDEIFTNARFYFANTDENIDFARPLSPKVVYIGGITVENDVLSKLSNKMLSVVNNATQIVIVSFGSLAKSSAMPKFIENSLVSLFEAFPEVTFIWKYENTSIHPAKHLPNVYATEWLPQKDLLQHPKVIGMVTHGGMNTVLESAYAGIPSVGIPLFADQHRNLQMLVNRKTGVLIRKCDVSVKTLIAGLETIFLPETQKNAKRLAHVLSIKPMSAKERFVKHIDFAVAVTDFEDYLDIKTRHLGFVRLNNLDVIAFLVTFIVIAFISVFKTLNFVFIYILRVPIKFKTE